MSTGTRLSVDIIVLIGDEVLASTAMVRRVVSGQ